MRLLLIILIFWMPTGCSTIDMKQYSSNEPRLQLYDYFQGQTKGWGIVQDRKGTLMRQFTVDIAGTVNSDETLTLVEKFNWSDGEKSQRIWTLSRVDDHSLTGKAADVIDSASGTLYGNVLNWQYTLNLELDDSTWKIKFDDWMFLVSDNLLLNKATMSKFGFKVGEVTIVFEKIANHNR